MAHRPGVFWELESPKLIHIVDPQLLEFRSALNSWSRKTVRPSLRLSWNQSRQVRFPVQLCKYSWPTTPWMPSKSVSVAVSIGPGHISGEIFRPLFSIARLKSLTATIVDVESYSRPKRSSSAIACLKASHGRTCHVLFLDVILSATTHSGSLGVIHTPNRPQRVRRDNLASEMGLPRPFR